MVIVSHVIKECCCCGKNKKVERINKYFSNGGDRYMCKKCLEEAIGESKDIVIND